MATLEKIRSKSVLLLVIIAVALLAFILGDFFTSGRTLFGTGTTVAKIDGKKIDFMEFQNRVNEASEMAQRQGQKVDPAVLQQQVLDGMIAEALFNEEIEKLGITVTDSELTDAMIGANSGYMDMMIQQQYGQAGITSAAQFHDMAYNAAKYQIPEEQAQQMRRAWMEMEKNMEQQLRQSKFQTLFVGTLQANDLDAKALYDENASTSNLVFAKKDYSTLDDAKYEVTDADINAVYKEQRNRYRLDEPTRTVDYIAVEIAPSAADLRAGAAKVEEAIKALAENEGTSGLEGMSEFVVTRENLTRSAIRDSKMKAFADSASVGSSRMVSHTGNTYTLAKLLNRKSEVDSVNIDVVAIQGTRAEADSALTALRSGTPMSEVAAGDNVAASNDSVWITLTAADYATLRPTLEGATIGEWFTPDSVGQGYRLFRVRTRRPAVTVFDIATAVYEVEPSAATINTLEGDLSRFINENKTAEAFAENAQAAGYNLQNATVSASTPRLGNLSESREAVAWAMGAKKGQVSPVLGGESTGRYLAVALENIYDGDYVPATDPALRKQLENRARNNKKAADIIAQYAGKAKDVAGYAKLMGTQVDTTSVTFGQIFIPKIGVNESKLSAATVAAKPGQLIGPIQGKNGVVVFTVTTVDTSERPFSVEESATQFNQSRGAGVLSRNISDILRSNKKVTNNLLKFYNR